MSSPKTMDELVAWFSRSHNPDQIRKLAESMITRPHPAHGSVVDIGQAWNEIIDHSYLSIHSMIGWVDRGGVLHSCGCGAHDRLLYWMDMEPVDAESLGWCRIGGFPSRPMGYQCNFRLTRDQKACLERVGILVDDGEERLKPVWKPATT